MGHFSAEMDSYLEGSIAHLLGLSCSEEQLRQKLEQVEQAQRDLHSQVFYLQRRLQETQDKYQKAKEEASLSAQALRRQIAETQQLNEFCSLVTEECHRLEEECSLYHNDREIFLEAADDAEERAVDAENRASEAESRLDQLVLQMERVQNPNTLDYQMENLRLAEELNVLRLTRHKLEADNRRLQSALDAVKYDSKFDWRSAREYAIKMEHQEVELRAELAAANERHRLSLSELQKVQKMYEEEKGHLRDEVVVHSMVSSAVTSAVCKAVEQEKEEELNAVKLEYESICMFLEAKLSKKQDRLKDAENNLKILGAEVRELKKNAQTYERNLKKAEIEVQVLFEENQTWNRLFKVKLEALDGQSVSPLHIQGIKYHSDKSYRRRSLGQENVSPILPRQPLTPLRSNFSERKTIHR
ncbi:hypothetical protein O6H91_08G061700 [Diphasiastrum complanatum]|uniref:Uncharacterized protein n=1 Tax=Diphasiastrum complanatum TaxID=34168 RepID=A0ACC2CY61_DIPCM|nr:hypothetical protein O6H91_Y093200 [Diphasiastrum complanatum]KAJ7546931.1 hypothetical protein O6H91_08G061700 [Diphasiastrum complanatum]